MPNLKGRRVLIGTPAYDWSADVRYIHSLGQTIRLCEKEGVKLGWLFPPGDAIIAKARNELMRDFLQSGCDDLVFIDADQDWKPEDFLRLISFDVDCVGAAVLKKRDDDVVEWNVHAKHGIFNLFAHPTLELLTAPELKVGTGFIRYSRRAVQLLWDNSEKYKNGGEEAAWICDVRPVNGELVGEDTFISEKLSALGVMTWLDPTITIGHCAGTKRWAKCFGEWLEEMQAKALNPPRSEVNNILRGQMAA